MKNSFSIVGYSGHSYVVLDSALKSHFTCKGYYDRNRKDVNPFNINYLGFENDIDSHEKLFISIGDNKIRRNIYKNLRKKGSIKFLNIVDPSSSVSKFADIVQDGSTSIGINSVVNCLARIDSGSIINTGAIIEHEVKIGKFTHVAPNAVICGNALIGENVFVGANSIVKQGVEIGDNSIIGAGSVVLTNVPANSVFMGNPAKSK